jgi:ABC-2 type transport system ATP-binding protein
MPTVEAMCDHAAWINKGTLMAVGEAAPTIAAYTQSYGQEG